MKRKSKIKQIVAHPSIRCPMDNKAIRPEFGPNAELLMDVICAEQKLAQKEKRIASSTKAIVQFEAKMSPKMSQDQICALWDWVFYYYCKLTGASVHDIHGQGMS